MWVASKNLGPIGLAVLTFINCKQTNQQTNMQSNYRFDNLFVQFIYIEDIEDVVGSKMVCMEILCSVNIFTRKSFVNAGHGRNF